MIRDRLIVACVRNLREFGYPKCDSSNVLTDLVYSRFAKSMLQETADDLRVDGRVRRECVKLIAEIDNKGGA